MINDKCEKTFGSLPVKVLQFGDGNFLRAFAQPIVEEMNRRDIFGGSVVICQPRGNDFAAQMNEQDCLYTVIERGREKGKTVDRAQIITSVKECVNPKSDWKKVLNYAKEESLKVVISNTTEAGISYNSADRLTDEPPVSYPAKLTAFLYERYRFFDGDKSRGLLILPVELIEKNGDCLKKIVLQYAHDWNLPEGFSEWLDASCGFANTLVDRIVTGYPESEAEKLCEKFGYIDRCIDTCEPFLFWAIECDKKWAEVFPADRSRFDVVFADDITAYKTRKVRILNGAHTVSVLAAFHCGYDIVLQMMNDSVLRALIDKVLEQEVIPTVDLPRDELYAFADAVKERFDNPFIRHRLLDISLNSVSKYKARCLGTLKDYIKLNGTLPKILVFGLAALVYFYKGEFENGGYYGCRGDEKYEIRDSESVLSFMNDAWYGERTVNKILSNEDFWDENLTEIDGLENLVSDYLNEIKSCGVKAAAEKLI